MDISIRTAEQKDVEAIHAIRCMKGVRENTNSIESYRISRTEKIFESLTDNDHFLVAEVDEEGAKKIVGVIQLYINKSLRVRHSGFVAIMVHTEYQGKGIGRKLFEKLLDIADNWIMLTRLELGVFVDNERAINLYKSLGFVIEGTKKFAAIKDGKYADEHIMARYHNIE